MNATHLRTFVVLSSAALVLAGCGRRRGFDKGEELEPAVLGGGGSQRVQSAQQVRVSAGTPATKSFVTQTIRRLKARPTYEIVPVTQIVQAQSGIPGWGAPELPFTGAAVTIGTPVADGQTPIAFSFSYPANNYQLSEAHLVIDTSRDTSDTEGIFVDGVLSGRPPTNMVNLTSPNLLHPVYFGNGSATVNTYYIDWSLSHYKRLTRNTFDLQLADLLLSTPITVFDALQDGALNVVTGDDSPVYQGFLVIKGLTTTRDGSLTCAPSDTFSFTNVYLHNDGNTIGAAAFSGSVGTPYTSWSAVGTYPSFELSFDAPLPRVEPANITVTNGKLSVRAKRVGAGTAAIVVNGIGVAEPLFDRGTATAAVETWTEDAVPAWEAFLAGVSTAAAGTIVELDLSALLGAATVRDLLAQGKLNVSIAGNLYFQGQNATATRGFGVAVSGPELKVDGTYWTQVCAVPSDPDSPLTQQGIVELEPEYEDIEILVESGTAGTSGSTVVENDGAGPVIGSTQALEITATSALLVWATDEPSSSQVLYGVGGPTGETPDETTPTTFHQVRLTGLAPYKYYSFQVVSVDAYGNRSVSPIQVFTTLR